MSLLQPRPNRRGGILINLLVVVAILAFLASILMPTLCRSSEQANRIKCASNLRAFGQMIAMYQNENGGHLPRTLADVGEDPTPTFYTGANASNPFAPDGPQPNDVTA